MAKIIDKLRLKYHAEKIEKLQAKEEFLENYRQILILRSEARLSQRLSHLENQVQEKLRSHAIASGTKTPDIEAEIGGFVKKADTRLYWQKRALTQSLKRLGARKNLSETEISRLEAEKTSLLENQAETKKNRYLVKYNPVQASASAKADYLEKSRLAQQDLEAKSESVRQLAQDRQKRINARKSQQIEAIRSRIARHKKIADKISSKLPDFGHEVPEDVILRLQGLTMRFGGLVAVDNLTFDVKKGEIFGLIGPNGAGKTTVFNCITKFYNPPAGLMYFRKNPVEVIRLNDYPVHKIIRQGIVRTFQNVELIWELSVIDNLLVAAHSLFQTGFFGQLVHSRKLRQEEAVLRKKAVNILTMLGLLPYQYMIPFGLPYGILKKIELARTLMVNPKMIILDEPAAGLNEGETADLAKLIRRIRDEFNTTIFLVEHDMGLVMEVCDTISAISFGKQIAIGSPREIQNNKIVREAYLGEEQS